MPQTPTNIMINGDMRQRAHEKTQEMPWSPSPTGTVLRRRVHLVGPPERGQVTSVVRFEPGAKFPSHPHPEGEEILILEGVFSDEAGDWGPGSFLLNPEGFEHSPSSDQGCTLFVKLRQYGGERPHVALDTNTLPWTATNQRGVSEKPLYTDKSFSETMRLEKWDQNSALMTRQYPEGAEYFVLDGSFEDEYGSYTPGSWVRYPCGDEHTPKTTEGCTLYVKIGGVAHLTSIEE